MAVGRWVAAIGCLLTLAGNPPPIAHATTELVEELSSDEGLFYCSALIAHVRVAGEIPGGLGDKRRDGGDDALWLVEILDAAHGPATGELAIVETRGNKKAAQHFRAGATFLLFATREIDSVYRPLPADDGVWPIDQKGKLQPHRYGKLLPPAVAATKPSDVVTWFWNEVQQHAFDISVSLNQHDLKHFDSSRPLRLTIAIDNTGGQPMSFNNSIEFEYDMRGDELIEEKKELSSLPQVKVYARPLVREHVLSDVARMLQQLSELTLSPGERCMAEFDLSQEPQIYGGMRYQLWVEVGGRSSRPIVFETPGGGEEMAFEKLAEGEGDGPFRKVDGVGTTRRAMPEVQATDEALAIQAALRAWTLERQREDRPTASPIGKDCDIVLLSRANLPREFSGISDDIRYVVADRYLKRLDKSESFKLSDRSATMRSKMLRVEQLEIKKQTARVVICEVEDDESGLLAIVRLVREQGIWRTAGEIELAIH